MRHGFFFGRKYFRPVLPVEPDLVWEFPETGNKNYNRRCKAIVAPVNMFRHIARNKARLSKATLKLSASFRHSLTEALPPVSLPVSPSRLSQLPGLSGRRRSRSPASSRRRRLVVRRTRRACETAQRRGARPQPGLSSYIGRPTSDDLNNLVSRSRVSIISPNSR